jgi:probable biosynthetic protein (TIGR04098 family)
MQLYDLTLGLPHTNHRFFSEHHLLKYAGHFQWNAIASALDRPLSQLRTARGEEVYASFYYVHVRIPAHKPLESFRLDDTLQFAVALRGYKNVAFEGKIVFDRAGELEAVTNLEALTGGAESDSRLPFLRFANMFITPSKGNASLRIAVPAGTDLTTIPVLPNDENPYHLTRAAAESGSFGLVDDSWRQHGTHRHSFAIDIDRDTNGAGLVYFANYVAFMDTAERLALAALGVTERQGVPILNRSLRERVIGYYGNADPDDSLHVEVSLFLDPADDRRLGFRTTIHRQRDQQLIGLAEAIKEVAAG